MAHYVLASSSGGGSGASNFVDLDDTPANYTGDSLKYVRVNVGETALEFTATSVITNTLDEAYDEGGAGAGRVIITDSGPVELQLDALGNTTDDAMLLSNNTAATLGTVQDSPSWDFLGSAWNATAGASNTGQMRINLAMTEGDPVEFQISIGSNVNGAGWGNFSSVDAYGIFTTATSFLALSGDLAFGWDPVTGDEGFVALHTDTPLTIRSDRADGSGNISMQMIADVNNATINDAMKVLTWGWRNDSDVLANWWTLFGSGLHQFQEDNLVTTTKIGHELLNDEDSTNGVRNQISPSYGVVGHTWDLSGTPSDRYMEWQWFASQPTGVTTDSETSLIFQSRVSTDRSGSWTTKLHIGYSDGNFVHTPLSLSTGASANSAVSIQGDASPQIYVGSTGGGTFNISTGVANGSWGFYHQTAQATLPNSTDALKISWLKSAVGKLNVLEYDWNGDMKVNMREHGQALAVQTLTEETPIANAAFTDTTIQIPADSLVIAVTTRVLTQPTGSTTMDVGVSGAENRYADDTSTVAGSTDVGTMAGVLHYSAATSIRITPDAVSDSNGEVRVTIHYIALTAPSS